MTVLLISLIAWIWMLLWTNALRVQALQRHMRTLQVRLAMRYLRRPRTDIIGQAFCKIQLTACYVGLTLLTIKVLSQVP